MEKTSGGSTEQLQAASSISQFLLNKKITPENQGLIINVVRKYFSDEESENFQEFRCEMQTSHPQVQEIFKRLIYMIEDRFRLDGQEAVQVLDYLENNLIEEYQKNHDFSREIYQAGEITREQIALDTHELAGLILGGDPNTEQCFYPSQTFGRDLYGVRFSDAPAL